MSMAHSACIMTHLPENHVSDNAAVPLVQRLNTLARLHVPHLSIAMPMVSQMQQPSTGQMECTLIRHACTPEHSIARWLAGSNLCCSARILHPELQWADLDVAMEVCRKEEPVCGHQGGDCCSVAPVLGSDRLLHMHTRPATRFRAKSNTWMSCLILLWQHSSHFLADVCSGLKVRQPARLLNSWSAAQAHLRRIAISLPVISASTHRKLKGGIALIQPPGSNTAILPPTEEHAPCSRKCMDLALQAKPHSNIAGSCSTRMREPQINAALSKPKMFPLTKLHCQWEHACLQQAHDGHCHLIDHLYCVLCEPRFWANHTTGHNRGR